MTTRPIIKLYSVEEIAKRLDTLAADISRAYDGRDLTILGELENGFVFLADLLRALKLPVHTSFLRHDHKSLGGIEDLVFSTDIDVRGRDILLIEGVLDTGVTQEYVIKQLIARGAASVRLCVLVDKRNRRRVAVEPNWRGFETQDEYVFGYGLGFQDRWKQLPYLATFERQK